jgi:hypothetical protein
MKDYDPRDPFDRLMAAIDFDMKSKEFEETMEDIRKAQAKARAEDAARFERKMLLRKIVRFGMWTTAAVLAVKAIQNANKESETED